MDNSYPHWKNGVKQPRIKGRKRNAKPLQRFPHPPDYDGALFITIIEHRKKVLLTVVDNADGEWIRAYLLDHAERCKVNEEEFFEVVRDWWDAGSIRPVSIDLSLAGIDCGGMLVTFRNVKVDLTVGPLPSFRKLPFKISKRKVKRPVEGEEVPNQKHVWR